MKETGFEKGCDSPDFFEYIDNSHFLLGNGLTSMVSSEDYKKWLDTLSPAKDGTKFSDITTYYSFAKYFNLTWEDFEEQALFLIDSYTKEEIPIHIITVEEWQIILNGTEEEAAKLMINDTAVLVGTTVYNAAWIYQSSIPEYIEAGITPIAYRKASDL